MPSIENWQKQPLAIVRNIFENRKNDDWSKQVHEYFDLHLKDYDNLLAIPSLNDCPLHQLEPNSLVRFRCMIQDTYDHEFFLETYDVVDKLTGLVIQKTSCFQDIISCPENCEINMESSKNKTGMRQILYCVSVPGETNWVKEAWKSQSAIKPNTERAGTSLPSQKRSHADGSNVDEMDTEGCEVGGDAGLRKRVCPSRNEEPRTTTSLTVNMNHPLPGETGPVCLVKLYDESAEIKVNEVMEFIGILSVDPALSYTYDSRMDAAGDDVSGSESGDQEETRAHHPPASLVPRLHVVAKRKMPHLNPLLPQEVSHGALKDEASAIRRSLLSLLEKATFGDTLAAEYLLLHLLARVYSRRDMLALGKFSMNLSGIPPNSAYPRLLSQFLKDLVTKLHYLPMTLERMNTLQFVPVKNYSTNRLDTGVLQLSGGTHLVLDETVLEPGTMDASGVKNIQALKNLLAFQKVDYNFRFHEASFESDINVLILSEGKSLLPCDCQVQIKPRNGYPEDVEQYFSSFCAEYTTEFLNRTRAYIDCVKLLDYELSEDMTQAIQNDFVEARRHDATKMSADDLHSWLVLARLLSLSVGHPNLTLQWWERVKALETQRKERNLEITGNRQRCNGL